MRARLISLGGMILVLLLAAPVLANMHDGDIHPGDQKLFHGYDPEPMTLVWAAILDAKAEDACTLEDDSGVFTYEIDDGEVTVVGAEGDCTFHATDATGPQGQVNHGTVVSSFVEALRDSGHEGGVGCFVRLIGGTDYGKGDQQVRVGDLVDAIDEADETTVELTESETTCGRPSHAGNLEPAGKLGVAGQPATNGKPDHAGKPDNSGKPAHAGGSKNR